MSYGIILTLASVLLAARHAADREASVGSRVIVAAVVGLTFVLPSTSTGWAITITLVRLAACLFVLLRSVARRAV